MICDSPFYVLPKLWSTEKVPVPCGRCPACKIRRVNSWVFRMLQEAKISASAHFVTLTYDTRFVPITENGFMTLRKREFQLFMKRLRKLCPGHLKYYAVGEYGTKNMRPHYHAVIFNVPDTQFFADAWSIDGVQFGGVHVGKVTGDSIAYTMKYIDKQTTKKQFARDDREPEFPLMSKGLGKNYLSQEIIDYHKSDISRMYVTKEGGHRIALPRYYREKIYSDEDKKQQVLLISEMVAKSEVAERVDFNSTHFHVDYSFEAYKESQRYGRYKRFYANNKNRDVL